MLKGLQLIQEADGNAAIADDWEMVGIEDWAMATVMKAAEGLNPMYVEAKRWVDWPKWQKAINYELASLKANKTWSLVKWPAGVNVADCKWVLHIKKNAAGKIKKYKARLVAWGFMQIHGIDFYKTYVPVAQLTSFQLLLVMANCNKWPVDIFDFDSAFLNSVLSDDEVVYLEQPKDFIEDNPKVYVLWLHKALYRLKQGAKNWYDALRKVLKELRFCWTEADHGVFLQEVGEEKVVILAVHVDDCLVAGSSQVLLDGFKTEINMKYKMTDLGPCK